MSEYDLFVQLIPCIAEIIATCRKMCRDSYGEWKEYWKKEFCKSAETTPDAKAFMEKIFVVIDTYV